MYMKKKLAPVLRLAVLFLFIAVFILPAAMKVNAQTVTISAVLRPRFEVQYGYKVPPDTASVPQILLSQRTRLNAAYNSTRFNAFISIQDARIWGDEVQAADLPSLGLHEGWVQYNFSPKVGLKVGRQEFKYDNKRLLTDGDWPQQGRAHDAAVLKLALNKGWRIDLAGSYNQQAQTFFGNFYNLSNYKTLGKSTYVAQVGGGVTIDPAQLFMHAQFHPDSGGKVDATRDEAIARTRSTEHVWWWD